MRVQTGVGVGLDGCLERELDAAIHPMAAAQPDRRLVRPVYDARRYRRATRGRRVAERDGRRRPAHDCPPQLLGRMPRSRGHAHAGHDDRSFTHHGPETPRGSARLLRGSQRRPAARCRRRAEMVDQEGVRLAKMTADDREELAEEVVTARAMEICADHELVRHRLADVDRERHARVGRDQARDDHGAGRCRESE